MTMQDRPGRLADKIVLITGTGNGQGRTAARIFAHEGATVVGADLDQAGNEQTVAELSAAGYQVSGSAPVDLADPTAIRAWVDGAIEQYGRIDVLYNNASVPKLGPFADVSEADYRFTVRNEIDIVWFPSQAVWPQMVKQGHGVIVNVGSIAGMVGDRGLPEAAHALTKGAVIALTRQLAAEGAPHGIRVNTVTPGVIANANVSAMLEQYGDQSPVSGMIAHTFNHSAGQLHDPVYAALFLASDEAAWITGQNLVVDGGTTVFI